MIRSIRKGGQFGRGCWGAHQNFIITRTVSPQTLALPTINNDSPLNNFSVPQPVTAIPPDRSTFNVIATLEPVNVKWVKWVLNVTCVQSTQVEWCPSARSAGSATILGRAPCLTYQRTWPMWLEKLRICLCLAQVSKTALYSFLVNPVGSHLHKRINNNKCTNL